MQERDGAFRSGGRHHEEAMYRIHFIRENKTAEVADGSNLLEVWRSTGLIPDAPCGGHGTCGKCRVRLPGAQEQIVKACETVVHSDLEVDTRLEAEIESTAGTGFGQKKDQILTEGQTCRTDYLPLIWKRQVRVKAGQIGESRSDWNRFLDAFGEQEDLAAVSDYPVNLEAASVIGDLQRTNQGVMWAVASEQQILQVSKEEPQIYTAAVDIGTTTIAAYLLDGADGSVCGVASCRNPQTQYGADVINRAEYAAGQGLHDLTECVRRAVNELLQEMTEKAGASVQEIYALCVAGNTCMHHLFLGISVNSLAQAPYVPAVSEAICCTASQCGISIHPSGSVWMLPNIAGFVGADTTSCLIASGIAEAEQWTLLVDIGTNGEMVLAKEGRLMTCSTAAGPAFEGAGISCGMRGAAGAISHIKWEGQRWQYETIDDQMPLGLCGSGLLDLAAELLQNEFMDETGYLEEEEIVLVDEAESGTGEAIRFTQRDVRQLQLAKGAIAAGIRMLAKKAGISIEEIGQVLIAGAFGSFMSPKSACAIGLIPQELEGRLKVIGNAAGEGAKLILQNRMLWKEAQELAAKAEFVELAVMKEFQDCFADEMEFPES